MSTASTAPDPAEQTVTEPAPSLAGTLEAITDALQQARDLAGTLPATVECGTYSVTDAARRLGISRRHAYDLIHEQRFPVRVLRVGDRLLVPRSLLDRFVAGDPDPTPRLHMI
jgi:excisionase family DNA binding protein